MPTYCEDCDHVQNPNEHWYKQMCIKFPRIEGVGFVTKTYRETDPYMKCKDINGGACPCFTPKRNGE